jgi:signal transduction histidine kinase
VSTGTTAGTAASGPGADPRDGSEPESAPRTRTRRSLRRTGTRRPRRMLLRTRLTLIHGGLFMAAGIVLLGVTYALFDNQLDRGGNKFTGAIREKVPPGASTDLPPPQARPTIRYRDADGRTVVLADAEKWLSDQRSSLQEAAASSLLRRGAGVLVGVGAVAAGFGWLVAGRVLAPLHRVTDTARRIAAAPAAGRGLHERIALQGPDDEVKDLADTFDTMVERLDRSFDGQRRFVANASHELRTPLTLGRALVEVAMHRRTASEDVRQLGENLLEINTRHERLISGLLLLADSENEITGRRPLDLADVVAHVVARTAAEATAAGITVEEAAGEAPVSGDALLIERLVHNLVENGIRHNTGPGGRLRIASRPAPGGGALVEVSNTGPVVPPYDIPSLFEPFRRLGSDRLVSAKGAGLGLSIVRAVARAHGGTVDARPGESGGLVVTAVLPP